MNATHKGCSPADQIDRPVMADGIVVYVVDANNNDGTLKVQETEESPVFTIPMMVTLPLCIHCLQPLEESEYEAPGSCTNPDCFLCR